jgi:hypothetical protein
MAADRITVEAMEDFGHRLVNRLSALDVPEY